MAGKWAHPVLLSPRQLSPKTNTDPPWGRRERGLDSSCGRGVGVKAKVKGEMLWLAKCEFWRPDVTAYSRAGLNKRLSVSVTMEEKFLNILRMMFSEGFHKICHVLLCSSLCVYSQSSLIPQRLQVTNPKSVYKTVLAERLCDVQCDSDMGKSLETG